jgi:ATP-dependent RNA helicase SUPV3L1/SUV3
MSDSHRGQAFTRAVLGLPAQELHLCGSPSVVEFVKKLCEKTDDILEINEYKRYNHVFS